MLDYATGIFPIKKYGEHSALNMYNEYTMQTAVPFSEFVGFTEEEVEGLCECYGLSPDDMKNLTYDFATEEAWIPNYEVREQFISTIRVLKWQNVTRLVQASAELLNATLASDSEKVAELIEAAHENYT